MARPWATIDRLDTPEGPLELRRRGPRDFLITVGGRVLMTSAAHRSEEALAELACAAIAPRPSPRVLIGGLGMGYTLRAALDHLPPGARVTVVELNPKVVDWCRGPLADLGANALADPRVTVENADVSRTIAGAPAGSWDAIVLDLYEGPHAASQSRDDPFYGRSAILKTREALRPGGVFAVWSEEPDRAFEENLAAAGLTVEKFLRGKGGRRHPVYIATRR